MVHKLFKNDIQKLFCGKKLDKKFATNMAVITYNDGFRGLFDDMSTLQLKINSELSYFSKEVDQRRIKVANCSVSKH